MHLKLTGREITFLGNRTIGFSRDNLYDLLICDVDTSSDWTYVLDTEGLQNRFGPKIQNIINLSRDGNQVFALLQSGMLPEGRVRIQFRGRNGDTVYVSEIVEIWVEKSIDYKDRYSPVPSEFEQIEARIQEYNNHPPYPDSTNGHWMIWNVDTHQYEESELPVGAKLPEISSGTEGKFLTNDGVSASWQELPPSSYVEVSEAGSATDVVNYITVDGVEKKIGGSRPYSSLKRISQYLYDISFLSRIDEEDLKVSDNLNGGVPLCSSYVQNGKLYRNLDWNYDENATFHIQMPGIEGLAFINGLTDSNLDDNLISQLPLHLVDGVNSNGIMISTHVLYNDWDAIGHGEIPLTYLPYIALAKVQSMSTIESDLEGILDNLKSTPALITSGYLIQVIVTDGITSYILRPNNSTLGTYEAIDITGNPKLANFRWVEEEIVTRGELQERPTGVERWNLMPCSLEDLRFTKAYEEPNRLSEFIGIDDTTKDSSDEQLLSIYEMARAAYLIRERDGVLWQTMHSVVYSPNGIEHLWVQEDWENDLAATIGHGYVKPEGGIPVNDLDDGVKASLAKADNSLQAYVHQQLVASQVWVINHNLNRYPGVTIVDTGQNVVVGDITYISKNQINITFTSAFSGEAFLN